MSQSNSFWDHPIDKLEEALSLRKQIATLQQKLSGMFSSSESKPASSASAPRGRKGGKRTVSAEARARMAASQKARWAKRNQAKGGSGGSGGSSTSSPASGRGAQAPKRKGGITPEGRAKLAAAMKARWAARKKGAPAPTARK
jgi:hypothetical protein